jgi:hypothetical protein
MNNIFCCVGAGILVVLLIVFITLNCYLNEYFTAPGLTLTLPPSWFTTLSGKKYDENDWKTKQYLDRYPFYDARTQKYLSYDDSNTLASAYRFWRF